MLILKLEASEVSGFYWGPTTFQQSSTSEVGVTATLLCKWILVDWPDTHLVVVSFSDEVAHRKWKLGCHAFLGPFVWKKVPLLEVTCKLLV